MAYRKRRVKHSRPNTRRRISVPKRKDSITRVLGLVGGAVLTSIINDQIAKHPDWKVSPTVVGLGEVALGYFLPTMMKSDLMHGVGDGLIAAGGYNLLKASGVIHGIPIVAGWKELNTVNGTPDMNVNTAAANSEFRPSMSQVLNGYYNRRRND